MKIAVVTEDEKTISQHFGMAPYYMVLTVEDGKITGKEKRDKMNHSHFGGQHGHGHHGGQGGQHGFDAASLNRHAGMAETIKDCRSLLTGEWGWALNSLKNYNIEPVITEVTDIEEAVKLYAAGNLQNLTERLH